MIYCSRTRQSVMIRQSNLAFCVRNTSHIEITHCCHVLVTDQSRTCLNTSGTETVINWGIDWTMSGWSWSISEQVIKNHQGCIPTQTLSFMDGKVALILGLLAIQLLFVTWTNIYRLFDMQNTIFRKMSGMERNIQNRLIVPRTQVLKWLFVTPHGLNHSSIC